MSEEYQSQIDKLREDCWDKNRKMRRADMSRWYWVLKTTIGDEERLIVEMAEGYDAEEIWRACDGHWPIYHKWTPERLREHRDKVRRMMEMGMPVAMAEANDSW